MSSLTIIRSNEMTEEVQAAIEEIAAHLSQVYGFDFPLDILELCWQQVGDVEVVQLLARRVEARIEVNPDDILDDERMTRHLTRFERAFQYYIDEHLNA